MIRALLSRPCLWILARQCARLKVRGSNKTSLPGTLAHSPSPSESLEGGEGETRGGHRAGATLPMEAAGRPGPRTRMLDFHVSGKDFSARNQTCPTLLF